VSESSNQPPHNLAAEQALIGGIMLNNAAWERVADIVTEADFYCAAHRPLWAAISNLLEADKPADVVTVAEEIERKCLLEAIGGIAYLRQVFNGAFSAANVVSYALAVREASLLRSLITAGLAQIEAAHNPDGRTGKDLLASAQEQLATLAERGTLGAGWITAKQAAGQAIERLERMFHQGGGMVGVSTGWKDLDDKTRGLEPGTLTILAARPSMGKTTAAVQMAQHVAEASDKPVALFSLEMSAESLAMRLLSSLGRVDHDKLRSATLDEDNGDWQRITPAAKRMSVINLHIDDQSGLSVTEIMARAKRLHRQHGGLSLIAIDYLGLIALPGKVENQNLGISKITVALKGLAKSLKVPVVLLSQLNREVEKRPNKRPMMSDLRDSGSIEQDADLIVFIYRDEVYKPDSKDKGVAEFIIAKHRNGPTGTVRLAFDGKHCRFDPLAYGWERDIPEASRDLHRYDYEY
jgi:replicative DNA helicase